MDVMLSYQCSSLPLSYSLKNKNKFNLKQQTIKKQTQIRQIGDTIIEKADIEECGLPDAKLQKQTDLTPAHKQPQTTGLPLGKGLCI